ncbi:MAG: acyltransferase [Desulfobacteraceae bacterium]|nr:MAG: acyltransferase [Desulfobacteraceae bacterium]
MPSDLRPLLTAASGPARTIAAGLIVLVHTDFLMRPGMETWWPGGLAFAPVFSLVVPLFLVFSGFFAGESVESASQVSWKGFLVKKAGRILVPFLIWNSLLIFTDQVLNKAGWSNDLIFPLLTGQWQLYYLFALMQLFVLHHFLITRPGRSGMQTLLIPAACFSFLFYLTADVILWTRGMEANLFETHGNRLFFAWSLFFALGVWFRQDVNALPRLFARQGLFTALTVLFYAAYYGELRLEEQLFGGHALGQILLAGFFFQVCACLLILNLLCRWSAGKRAAKILKSLAALAPDSYGIYLVHTPILICLYAFSLPFPIWVEVPVYWVITFLIAFGLVRLVRVQGRPWLSKLLLGEKTAPGVVTGGSHEKTS